MEIKTRRRQYQARPGQMVTLLAELGLRYHGGAHRRRRLWGRKGFWQREEHRLSAILWDARLAFREQIKKCHPDRSGDEESAKRLNRIWQAIERRFAQRGITLCD